MIMRVLASCMLSLCMGSGQAAPPGAADVERLRHSADAGDAQAAFDLGRLYRHGTGVGRDSARAFALVQAAARRDHPAAMFTLSNMLAAGEGARKDEALQQLALHLQTGAMGFERDEGKAAQLMREMAHAMKHRAQEH